MGEIAEMMLDGTLCQMCGTFLTDDPQGFPETCDSCKSSETKNKNRKKNA